MCTHKCGTQQANQWLCITIQVQDRRRTITPFKPNTMLMPNRQPIHRYRFSPTPEDASNQQPWQPIAPKLPSSNPSRYAQGPSDQSIDSQFYNGNAESRQQSQPWRQKRRRGREDYYDVDDQNEDCGTSNSPSGFANLADATHRSSHSYYRQPHQDGMTVEAVPTKLFRPRDLSWFHQRRVFQVAKHCPDSYIRGRTMVVLSTSGQASTCLALESHPDIYGSEDQDFFRTHRPVYKATSNPPQVPPNAGSPFAIEMKHFDLRADTWMNCLNNWNIETSVEVAHIGSLHQDHWKLLKTLYLELISASINGPT